MAGMDKEINDLYQVIEENGQSDDNPIRSIFIKAISSAPSVILLKDLDVLAKGHDSEWRLKIIKILERELQKIHEKVVTRREEILRFYLENLNVVKPEEIDDFVKKLGMVTAGYVAKDLEKFVRLAVLHALRGLISKDERPVRQVSNEEEELEDLFGKMSLNGGDVENEMKRSWKLDWDSFEYALSVIKPSQKIEFESVLPNRLWSDIGGPSIYSKYLGETENIIRNLFKTARRISPCIVFFDEIDSIASRREWYDEGADMGVNERVLSTLLNEMDGIQELNDVLSSESSQSSPQDTDNRPTLPQTIHFFVYPIPGTRGDDPTSPPPFIFFAPFFVPQEARKNVSESTMKKLPIVKITQEHINAQPSCPICLEPFSLSSDEDGGTRDRETSSLPDINNTCPLCREEIPSENDSQESNEQTSTESVNPIHSQDATMDDASLSTSTESDGSFAHFSHTHAPPHNHSSHPNPQNNNQQASVGCALSGVGCCGELQNNEESHTTSPIVTLPQCHHRFHASCLRTSLIVEGYSFESLTSQQLYFHCPVCRSPAIIQTDVLKIPSANLSNNNLPSPQEQQQTSLLNLPVIIPHSPPDLDAMDLD
ncbi:7827_t:CDS:10 [Acaulospora colombiana]|uniref:7827_t:CDS:1 n=1 Tax=Acaulospora colombiana TaxID=27376 RepID=A0ACA9LPS3_9GLOM|nr:7827_t:CDS:10 [Acaulospora colombiana]